MTEPFLKSQLEPVARRHRRLLFRRGLALCWAGAAAVGLLFMLVHRLTGLASALTIPLLAVGAIIAVFIVWRRTRKWQPDYRLIARKIEQHQPELHALLLTAVEQQPDPVTGHWNFLQERVIREAAIESQKHNWIESVPKHRLVGMQLVQLATLGVFVFVLTQLRVATTAAGSSAVWVRTISVTPGDALIERGTSLSVLARFKGPLPPEVTLVVRPDAKEERRIPLVKSLDDPMFGATVPEISADLTYHVEYDGEKTPEYKVRVFDYPKLERADAQLTFPDYTGLPEKKIADTRRISAVEGSVLELSLQLNKPIASARLVARDKTVVSLVAETNKAGASLKQFPLTASKSYELQLVDAEGRTNKIPAQFIFDVLKNRAPDLKFASPRGDQRVSALEEITFQAEAWDDFGLRGYGLSYAVGGGEPKSISLGDATAANEKRQFNYLLKLEDLGAHTDDLISYFVWADDIGPDGQVRRTASDMYFAEVRPFEEIFREGQGGQSSQEQQQQEQQQGSPTEKLAELQKQIINATWKLQRQKGGVSATNKPQ
jgi:hypothetical protein